MFWLIFIPPPPPPNERGISVSQTRAITQGIGFKLTFIISMVLFVVFAGKAIYDGYVDYSSEIDDYSI